MRQTFDSFVPCSDRRRLNPMRLPLLAAFSAGALILTGLTRPAHAQSAYASAVLVNNPVAYFRLGSTTESSLVNGFTTTFNNQATVTTAGGGAPLTFEPNNVGASFNGSSGTFVSTSLNGQAGFATGSTATILAWVNLSQLPSSAGRILYVAGRSQTGNDLDIQFQTDNRLYFYSDSGTSTVYAPDQNALVGNYHFIAATLDTYTDTGGNLRNVRTIYFDGVAVATDTNLNVHTTSAAQFNIGESTVFPNRQFTGAIDEVALYNNALTGQQIQDIYNARLLPADTPEPGTLPLLGLGLVTGLGVARVAHRRKQTLTPQ